MPLHEISAVDPGGQQLAYVEFVSAVTVSATVESTPNDVVSSGAITYDGTRICIEFFAVRVDVGATAGSFTILTLWDDATDLGRLALLSTVNLQTPVFAQRYLTPSAGSHTYKIRAWRINSNGTVNAGAGGTGLSMPGFIRVTRVPA